VLIDWFEQVDTDDNEVVDQKLIDAIRVTPIQAPFVEVIVIVVAKP
jgi:hypothetical protein